MATIPFLYSNPKDDEDSGIKISLLANTNAEEEAFETFSFDSSGLRLAGIANVSNKFKGVEIAGLVNSADGDLNGVSVAGCVSYVRGELNGLSYGTLVNYARTNGRLAIQISAFNIVKNYNPEGTVIQIGLYNQAGSQSIPFLNIRKKSSKKKLENRV